MNWDAYGAVGEVVGAIAVVVSVAYLAVQIRRQTDQARLAATRDIGDQRNDLLHLLIEDSEVANLYLKAVNDYDSLPNNDRIRMTFLFQQLMRLAEQQHLHVKQGNIDPAYFDSMDRTYFEWLTFPGTQQWWTGSKEFFEPEFRERIDTLIDKARERGYQSTFREDK